MLEIEKFNELCKKIEAIEESQKVIESDLITTALDCFGSIKDFTENMDDVTLKESIARFKMDVISRCYVFNEELNNFKEKTIEEFRKD